MRLDPQAGIAHATFSSFYLAQNHITSRRAVWPGERRREILVINGHPDPRPERFCAALCDAYAEGLQSSNGAFQRLNAGHLTFSVADKSKNGTDTATGELEAAADLINRAGHLMIVFPIWLDEAPLPLQRLLRAARSRRREALASSSATNRIWQTARTIATMEMPAFAHRPVIGSKSPSNTAFLSLPGIMSQTPTFIGCVNAISDDQRQRWLKIVHSWGLTDA
jgi:putative NADPH-quinone reductase